MQHIEDLNKKSLESQQKIYKSLRKLLQVKPLSEITVTDISEDCDISRSTFYRNFNNVMEILEIFFDYYYDRYLKKRIYEQNQLLFFLEYFLGCIFKEQDERTTSISCFFLMIMAAINVTCYFIDFLTRI